MNEQLKYTGYMNKKQEWNKNKRKKENQRAVRNTIWLLLSPQRWPMKVLPEAQIMSNPSYYNNILVPPHLSPSVNED